MRDIIAQTRSERVSKLSKDLLLVRGNTLQSDKDSMKLNKLMELCITLQSRVFDLEKTKTTQALEIDSLKRRVKRLEKKQRSRTHKLRRLYKVGLTARVESSDDEQSLEESTTTTIATIPKPKSQDKGKAIMIEEPVKLKKKDQIMLDEEVALKLQAELQAEFDKEKRLAKKKKVLCNKEEKRNKPPTKAQQISIMCTYLKNMKGSKLDSLKSKSFANIQELFDKAMKRVNTFVDYNIELVEKSSKKGEAEIAIDAIPLAVKPPSIVDWKIHKEGKKSTRVKTASKSYYYQYKEVTTAQVEVSAAQDL
nr:hypothetical protein [Tanacetum cinerariifolium]